MKNPTKKTAAKSRKTLSFTDAASYAEDVETLAEELRPRFLSGEFRGWHDLDGDRLSIEQANGKKWRPPLWRLEEVARARIATSQAAAFLALSFSRHARWDTGALSPRLLAGDAVAQDLLSVARREGWLRRGPGYTLPKRPAPTPVDRAERVRSAQADLEEARQRAQEALPGFLDALTGSDPSTLAAKSQEAYSAVGYLQAMAARAVHLSTPTN